jgi:hypothetical protein
MRKFLFALVLLIGVLFIMARFAEVQAIVETLQRGDWRFIAVGSGDRGVVADWQCLPLSIRFILPLGLNERLSGCCRWHPPHFF